MPWRLHYTGLAQAMGDRTEYRSGIGLVLINRQGLIFQGRRRDNRDHPWQLPQGGLEPEETPEQAVFREMREELGADHALIADSRTDWLRYDYPSKETSPRAKHFRGQQHRWFLLHYLGRDDEINLNTPHPEFSHWRWAEAEQVISQAIPFKQAVYRQALEGFGLLHHRQEQTVGAPLQALAMECTQS